MHITSMQVANYRGLRKLNIGFEGPKNNESFVNVIIGKNGSGKTTVLELISRWFSMTETNVDYGSISVSDGPDFSIFKKIATGQLDRKYTTNLDNEVEQLASGHTPPFEYPQFIYLPALLQFKDVNSNIPLSLDYKLSTEIRDNILSRTSDYIKEFVIAHERKQSESEPTLRAKLAIDAFNKPFVSLKLSTRLHSLDENNLNKPLFRNIDGQTFDINGLSDGEKQIYGRIVGLMMLQPRNSVILVDEPEIAIHPAWQYRILDVYKSVGPGNQFIVATHSPQILSSVSWQSIQVISREEDNTVVTKLPGPPTGIDSASILGEIMGADFFHPELYALQREYRELFDDGRELSEEGIAIRNKLEDIESQDSEFLQELSMIEEIRNRKNA